MFFGSLVFLFAETSTSEVSPPVPPKNDSAALSVQKKQDGHKNGSGSVWAPRIDCSEVHSRTPKRTLPKGLASSLPQDAETPQGTQEVPVVILNSFPPWGA
jgi:hypothetical protein